MPPKAQLTNLIKDLKASYQFSENIDCPECHSPLFRVYITPGLLSVDIGPDTVTLDCEPNFDIQEVICQNCGATIKPK